VGNTPPSFTLRTNTEAVDIWWGGAVELVTTKGWLAASATVPGTVSDWSSYCIEGGLVDHLYAMHASMLRQRGYGSLVT
jgi:hypothetical protein